MNLSESHVVGQCIDFLKAERFIPVRQHVGLFYPAGEVKRQLKAHNYTLSTWKPITIGEAGNTDWLIAHPNFPAWWLELKKTKGGIVSPEQIEKHAYLRRIGYLLCVSNGLDHLQVWMEAKGMYKRRGITWCENPLEAKP